jgi:hypothetical protein
VFAIIASICGRSLVTGITDDSVEFSLEWFRTSACHVDDPGSNPGDRTKTFWTGLRKKEEFNVDYLSPTLISDLLGLFRRPVF